MKHGAFSANKEAKRKIKELVVQISGWETARALAKSKIKGSFTKKIKTARAELQKLQDA